MRFRPALVVLFAAASAIATLSGCSGENCGAGGQCRASPEVTLSVPTDDSLTYEPAGDYAGLEGTLRGERSGSRACLYIESEAGATKGRVNLIFPKGYSSTDQLVLFDAEHQLIAKSRNPVVAYVAPTLSDAAPEGCSSAGRGTAKVLHIEPPASG